LQAESESETKPADNALEWRLFVRLGIGEFPIRNFFISRLWLVPPSRANILVTNLRVILYGIGGTGIFGRHRILEEVHLDKVIGLQCFIAWGLNLWMLGGGILMLAAGLLPFLHVTPLFSILDRARFSSLLYALIILGILFILLCFRQLFYVSVKAFGGLAQELTLKAKRGFGWSAGPDFQFGMKPGPDALTLVRELGAVILDAQNGEGTPEPSFSYPVETEPTEPPRRGRGTGTFGAGLRRNGLHTALGSERRRTGEDT